MRLETLFYFYLFFFFFPKKLTVFPYPPTKKWEKKGGHPTGHNLGHPLDREQIFLYGQPDQGSTHSVIFTDNSQERKVSSVVQSVGKGREGYSRETRGIPKQRKAKPHFHKACHPYRYYQILSHIHLSPYSTRNWVRVGYQTQMKSTQKT